MQGQNRLTDESFTGSQMNLLERDQHDRMRALDPTRSFIVQAPAGSGKTELLIQRFLKLLNHVNKPEEILAITFTKKAANEMRTRVLKALKNAESASEPESAHAKQTYLLAKSVLARDKSLKWNILHNPNQLRIQTIDSLCSYLTKQLPLLSHFGSNPSITDNPSYLYSQAVQEVLTHLEEEMAWSQDIAKLLLHLDNNLNGLHDLLVQLLAKRDQWMPYIHFNQPEQQIRKELEANLADVITDSLSFTRSFIPKAFIPEMIAIAVFTKHLSAPVLPPADAKNKTFWVNLAKLFLTKKSANQFEWRKRADEKIGFIPLKSLKNKDEIAIHKSYRERYQILLKQLNEYEDLKVAFSELFFLPDDSYQDQQWDILLSLLKVLKVVTAELRLTFQQRGEIDFIENAQAALLALGTDAHPTDLSLALDYQVKHILVDEFQDTSYTQYHLLEKLTMGWEAQDGRTLFVVGDPMQSIYRFREAEVGLFIRMRQHGLGQIPLIPLTLAVNFRSSAAIVDWNNQQFSKIFPQSDDIAAGAVTYSHSASTNHDQNIQAVCLRGFVSETDVEEINSIVTSIQTQQQTHPEENIAILVRSRAQLENLIPALKKANLNYHAVDIDALSSKQCIQDLLTLTCAMLHPADRIAWLALLRAPWCGLTLADLVLLAGNSSYEIIWENLQNPTILATLSEDGQNRVNKIIPILSSQLRLRNRVSLRGWIESTWLLLGGPACLHHLSETEDANAYFKLLESVKMGLNNIDQLKQKIHELYASPQYHQASLQIMTIHNAKGLEFDTVILPNLDRSAPHADQPLLLWMERPLQNGRLALLLAPLPSMLAPDPLYEYIKRQQKIKVAYESDRVFYVAATRAKQRLWLFFTAEEKEEKLKMSNKSFLGKLEPLIKKEANTILSRKSSCVSEANMQEREHGLYRIQSTWKNPILAGQDKPVFNYQQKNGFLLRENKAQLIGKALHRVLQAISQLSIKWWESQKKPQQKAYLKMHFQQAGLLPHLLEETSEYALSLIDNVLKDEKGRWILHGHTDAQSEYPLTAIIDGKAERLIIDRTFVDNDTRWIIDYKTTTFKHDDLKQFLSNEKEKYAKQMQKYLQAMQLIETRAIRLALYFPALLAFEVLQ